jgi:hypothetical protein
VVEAAAAVVEAAAAVAAAVVAVAEEAAVGSSMLPHVVSHLFSIPARIVRSQPWQACIHAMSPLFFC